MDHTLQLTGLLRARDAWSADACSIRRALEVAGTRSALLILREAFYGTTRFDDFAARAQVSRPLPLWACSIATAAPSFSPCWWR